MSKSLRLGLLAGCLALLFGAAAEATPIDYVFTGTGTGSLGGTGGTNASSGVSFAPDSGGTAFTNFTVTLVGNTSAVTGSVATGFSNDASTATFASGPLTATFSLASRVTETTADIIIFGENQPSPVFFVAEGLSNSVFGTYGLATDLASTAGTVSFLPQIFSTSAGELEFDSISALSFRAVTPTGVPEPASLTIMLASLGLLGYRARRRRHAAV